MFRVRALAACLLTLSTGVAFSGCHSAPGAPAPDVWAVVNGHEIRQDDVVKTYRREAQNPPASTTDAEALSAELSAVDEIVAQELLLARAHELKIDVTDAEVDTAYGSRRANLTDAEFQKALEARHLTADDLRTAMRRDLIAQKVLEQEAAAKVEVTDTEIADYFASHRAELNVSETQYHIAQILVTPVRDPLIRNRKNDDATTVDEAKKKFEMLKARLNAGASFGELAADYSEDPQTAPQGGDLGIITESQLSRVPPQLRDVIVRTTPGNVGAATAGGGYTLVAVISKDAAGPRDLNSPGMHDTIKSALHDRKAQLLRAAYLADLRGSATVVNYAAKRILATHGQPPALTPGAPGK